MPGTPNQPETHENHPQLYIILWYYSDIAPILFSKRPVLKKVGRFDILLMKCYILGDFSCNMIRICQNFYFRINMYHPSCSQTPKSVIYITKKNRKLLNNSCGSQEEMHVFIALLLDFYFLDITKSNEWVKIFYSQCTHMRNIL